jgi:hypothetical protein
VRWSANVNVGVHTSGEWAHCSRAWILCQRQQRRISQNSYHASLTRIDQRQPWRIMIALKRTCMGGLPREGR